MQQFHTHGDSCATIETEALKLAASGKPNADDEEPLKLYNQMLDGLGTSLSYVKTPPLSPYILPF